MITKRTPPKAPDMIRLLPLLLLPAIMTRAADISWIEDAVIQQARKAVVKILMPPRSHLKDVAVTGGVLLDVAQRTSTGFFATPDGLVILSAAGLEGTNKISLVLHDGRQVEDASLLAVDPLNDLAVLRTGVAAPHFLVGAAQQPDPRHCMCRLG